VAGFVGALGFVPGEDLVAGELEGEDQVRVDAVESGRAGLVRDPDVLDATAVEPFGQVAQGGVAPVAYRGDDLADRARDIGIVATGARREQRFEGPGEAAEVSTSKHGERPILCSGFRNLVRNSGPSS